VPELRDRFAKLTQTSIGQLQNLKVSRYDNGDEFTRHTDAVPIANKSSESDWYGDLARPAAIRGERLGQCPFPGANRFITVFVYLNTVESGGSTDFHWTQTDREFYKTPRPSTKERESRGQSSGGVSIQPEAGMAVIHFPAIKPELGGLTDPNASHRGAAAVDTKFIAQQFIFSHEVVVDHLRGNNPDWTPTSKSPDLSSTL
jgi:hypothetical protein